MYLHEARVITYMTKNAVIFQLGRWDGNFPLIYTVQLTAITLAPSSGAYHLTVSVIYWLVVLLS